MKKTITLIIIIFVLGVANLMRAQNSFSGDLVSAFKNYRSENYQEKIFVDVNRKLYIAGETIWFSVYCVNASTHKPSDVSKIAYFEILSDKKEPIAQLKIELKNGVGEGSFFIPVSVSSGNYMLRSYTRWMQNYSEKYFFHSPITIINTLKNINEAQDDEQKYSFHFMPEGGTLLAGIESRIGFIGVDKYQRGISFTGSLINSSGNTVAEFKPDTFGIGSFTFIPQKERYIAVINMPNGKTEKISFPEVLDQGYSMKIDEVENLINIRINTGLNNKNDYRKGYLFGHCREQMFVFQPVTIQSGEAIISVDKHDVGEGVNHFTLFNEQQDPVCERLYFKMPENRLNITFSDMPSSIASRKNVSFGLHAQDDKKTPVKGNFSISVFRVDLEEEFKKDNIFNYLYLLSDLGMRVECPEFYFEEESAKKSKALDNLMLISKWERFNWSTVNNNTFEHSFIPEYAYHIVKGKVTDKNTQKPAASIPVYLAVAGKPIRLNIDVSGEDGTVMFEMEDFYGNHDIVLQNNYKKDTSYAIEIESPFYEGDVSWILPPLELKNINIKELHERNINMQVLNTYFKDEQSITLEPPYADTLPFYGKSDKEYYLDNYVRFPVMEEVMTEYIKELWIRKHKDDYSFSIFSDDGSLFSEEPLTLIDGIPVFDLNRIIQYDPLNVKKLEIVKSKYHLGQLSFSGIASFETYDGNLEGFKMDERALILPYSGTQIKKELVYPYYSDYTSIENKFPDYRSQLYWKGQFKTNSDGNGIAEFSTSDLSGSYIMLVQGITSDGKIGMSKTVFKVSKD